MKTQIILALLALALAACAPAAFTPAANATDVQNTAVAIVQTSVALTQAALPTATPLPPTFTPTLEVTFAPATVMPTQPPPPILTPDTIQVERWQEYQTELAKVLLFHSGTVFQQLATCEWDILGRSGQEVYVWAYCAAPGGEGGNSEFAVIYLASDGSIQKVSTVSQNVNESELFPEEVREKFELYRSSHFYGRARDLMDHHLYRETHPEEPPLIVISATPIATLTP